MKRKEYQQTNDLFDKSSKKPRRNGNDQIIDNDKKIMLLFNRSGAMKCNI